MRLRSIPLLATRVIDMRVTPHRGFWRDESEEQFGGRVAFFQFTLAGSAIGNIDGRTLSRGPGSIQVLRSGVPFHYVSDAALHSVSLWVPMGLLSGSVVDSLRRMLAFDLQDDTSARGATAIIRSLLSDPPEPGSAAAAGLEAVLLSQLETVTIAASSRAASGEHGNLFARIRAVAAELRDETDLEPAGIAEAIGVTPAAVTRSLLSHRTSLAQLVRELRFDQLCALLREDDGRSSLASLAERAGYAGADQAARAFRERTGVTMSAYRRLVRL